MPLPFFSFRVEPMTESDKILQLLQRGSGEPPSRRDATVHGDGNSSAAQGTAVGQADGISSQRQQSAADGANVPVSEQWDGLKINELQTSVRELSDYIQSIRRELRVGIQKETGVPLCIVHNSATRRMIRQIISEPEPVALSRLKAE